MRDERDSFTQVFFSQMFYEIFDAQPYLPCRFAAGETHVSGGFQPCLIQLRKFSAYLVAGKPFPRAVINVEQVGIHLDLDAMCVGKRCRGFERAGQRTGIHRRDFFIVEPRRDLSRLLLTVRV